MGPGSGGHWQRMKKSSWGAMGGLSPGTDRTGSNKPTNILLDRRPPEMSPVEGQSSGNSWVAGPARRVVPLENPGTHGLRDKDTVRRTPSRVRLGFKCPLIKISQEMAAITREGVMTVSGVAGESLGECRRESASALMFLDPGL